MTPINVLTVRQCWAALLLLSLAASSAPSQGLAARSLSNAVATAPWSPSHQCVKVLPNTDISPSTRGPTTEQTYTYEKKFDDIDECFEQCQGHFIVQSKASGRCYCWREQGCQAVGFCDDGDCPGEAIGKWGLDSTEVVYDQSGCYGEPCEKYTGMEASSDSATENHSSGSEEDASSGEENQSKGPWSPSHQCVKVLPNTDISPSTRGPTTEQTYTYEKKFDDIDECFEQCQGHFIAQSKASGRCYCWREQSCQAVGFCDDGDCPGEAIGKWGSDSTEVVYDQSGCYGEPCERYTGMEDSNDSEEEKDSSSESEEERNCYLEPCPDEKGPWRPCDEGERCSEDQYREECDYDGDYDTIWNDEEEGWACTGEIAETFMTGFEIEWKSTYYSDDPNKVESDIYDGTLSMCRGLMPRGYWEEWNEKKYLDPVISGAGDRYNWISYNNDNGACSIMDKCGSLEKRNGLMTAKYCNFLS